MQNNPGRAAHPTAAVPPPCPEFTEAELAALDRAHAKAKTSGALIRLEVEAAMRMDPVHSQGFA
jgi:hypothetical protein